MRSSSGSLALVASGELARQGKKTLDQLGARGKVAIVLEALEELSLVNASSRRDRRVGDGAHMDPPFDLTGRIRLAAGDVRVRLLP